MDDAQWNERYAQDVYAYGREPNDFLRAHAERIPSKGRVLCLAEGEGRNAVYLARLGHRVTAVDFSAEGLRKAANLAKENDVELELVQADLASFKAEDEAFDGIVSFFAHVSPRVRQTVHAWVPRALRHGGVFLLEAYTPKQLDFGTGGPKSAELCMTWHDLQRELAPLQFEIGHEIEREIHEGLFHRGQSATVQIVARRVAGL